ncbi:MAG: UDP-N-acetylglucosamine 1-carboxyvinyltransferase [Candidatus Pacebacteria bacterium RIFCSPHIGHO2_01_FULL_46_10]|nr:MAG: UDP-N-acetylglucosamine 1-carboxyvinyltransferase [Candidatus Pacebacteria bacterium RIFCSPHIGHO2_01_FULL_46_10]
MHHQSFIIHGGKPLFGSVRLGGAKNASFKLMIASLLAKGETRLLNFSHIKDVEITREILEELGASTRNAGERTVFISTQGLHSHVIPEKYGKLSRASILFLGPLLARFCKAVVPFPGGDQIGARPIDRHLDGLIALGAKIHRTASTIEAECDGRLHGTTYTFEKSTHTGTETMIMAAVLAEGKTVLNNVALEPEIDDLIEFLNNMGAKIQRHANRVIEVEGVKELTPTIHRIMPDRNEAVSYACAAIATHGDIIVENARHQHLKAFLDKLDEMGAGYEVGTYGIRFFAKNGLKAVDVVTAPHPGFMTDWQPLWAVLLTQTQGKSVIHETVSENRFQYVPLLQNMGAEIRLFNPEVKKLEDVYEFDVSHGPPEGYRAAEITGVSPLKAGEFTVPDLRAGATLVLAGLVARGTTTLHNIEQIDRGYEELDSRLRGMGAEIVRSTEIEEKEKTE